MASDVLYHLHFGFECDIPNVSGTQPLGGGVSNWRPTILPDHDANMTDARGGADPLDNHGLVNMLDFVRVIAQVAALETTLHTVNTNLTNMSTHFSQIMAHYAASVYGSTASGGPILVFMPPLVLTPLVESIGPLPTQEGAMLKNMKPPMFKGEERNRHKDGFFAQMD